MKKIHYLLFTLLVVSAISCKKFLQEKPAGIITTDNFYKTQSDAIAAVNAVYFMLNAGGTAEQTPYNVLLSTGMDMATDDVDPGPGASNADVRSLSVLGTTSTNRTVFQLWQQHYAAIGMANVALAKVPGISMDTALQKRLLGEAKFLRALYYFNVVRLWGDVPLVLTYNPTAVTVSSYAIARTPATEVYAQIEKDLTEAAAVLPNSYQSPDVGRATKGAALSLLAKVYLTTASLPLNITANYPLAISTALEALSPADGGTGKFGYALQTNYANVFLPMFKNNSEHIFSAQFKSLSQGQGNNQCPRAIYNGVPGLVGNYAEQVRFYTKGADNYFSIYKLYQATDIRKHVAFVTQFVSPTSGKAIAVKIANAAFPNDSTPFFNKAWDPSSTAITSESAANVSVIRYAELLLIHAEAENELNGPSGAAYASINKVRSRAGLPNLPGGLTQDQFRDSVYLERRLELVWEYQRWFDLIRQKDIGGNSTFVQNLHTVGKTNAQDYRRLYPIPLSELTANSKISQNPGY